MSNRKDLDDYRDRLGTGSVRDPKEKTRFWRGGQNVEVRLVEPQAEVNFYRGMYTMAVSTWGGADDWASDRWSRVTPAARKAVVRAVLQRKALPLALEYPSFLFEVSGCSRSAFDQLARARIGVVFASMGTRDNAHSDLDIVVPPHVFDDDGGALDDFIRAASSMKTAYKQQLKRGRSWQDARALLPQSVVHRFCIAINYAALQGLCSRRLMFCEQYDTVAVAWKLKQELGKRYAMLAEGLRPGCDFARRCTYHEEDALSEAFGCLFKGCGRWPDPQEYAEFSESSTNPSDVEIWLGEPLVAAKAVVDFDRAARIDRRFFEED